MKRLIYSFVLLFISGLLSISCGDHSISPSTNMSGLDDDPPVVTDSTQNNEGGGGEDDDPPIVTDP